MLSRGSIRILCFLTLGLSWLTSTLSARADNPIDAAVLKKVKAATVHLEVTLPGGEMVEGSGFFTDEPGVILTNAHVLGMLDADSRPPTKITATVNSGETDSKALTGKLLGVDRGSDLAVVRVEGKDFPEALKVVPAKGLTETQEVYIFGFPLGKKLGKNITVSKSSVSSLRKGANGVLNQIQVNGGMHPGNSGGPVVDGMGQVVGVSVSGITGTQLNFAIPGETVHTFLNGRIVELGANLGYKDGDKVKMSFRIAIVDPLGRVKNVVVETWSGDPSMNRRRPASMTEPKPLPNDTPHEVIEVKYEKEATTSIELSLPLKEDAKKVYWMQPHYTNGAGETRWYSAWAPNLGEPVERKEITLKYQPRLDRTQPTEIISEGSFRIHVEKNEITIAANSRFLLNEHSAAMKMGTSLPLHFDYKSYALSLLKDKKPIEGEDELKKLLGANLKFMNADLVMEADGSAGQSKADLSKVPKNAKDFLSDVSDQVLQSLELVTVPLPDGTMKPLQNWKVQRPFVLGSTILYGVPAQADIKYTYLGTRMLKDREIAFLNISGTVKGTRGAGLNVGGTVTGATLVALDTGEVLSASVVFKADADVETKNGKAKLYGNSTVHVHRDTGLNKPPEKPPEKPAEKP